MSEQIGALLTRLAAIKAPLETKREDHYAALNAHIAQCEPKEREIRAAIKKINMIIWPVDQLTSALAANKKTKGPAVDAIVSALAKQVAALEVK